MAKRLAVGAAVTHSVGMFAALVRPALSAFFPATETLPGAEQGIGPYTDRFLTDTSWLMWLGIVGGALLYQVLPVWTVHRPVPAALLGAESRGRHAEAMADSSVYLVRQAAFLLKMVAGLHWAALPEVREAMGLEAYAPDPDAWRTA